MYYLYGEIVHNNARARSRAHTGCHSWHPCTRANIRVHAILWFYCAIGFWQFILFICSSFCAKCMSLVYIIYLVKFMRSSARARILTRTRMHAGCHSSHPRACVNIRLHTNIFTEWYTKIVTMVDLLCLFILFTHGRVTLRWGGLTSPGAGSWSAMAGSWKIEERVNVTNAHIMCYNFYCPVTY